MLIDEIIINLLIVLFVYLILYVLFYAFVVFQSTKRKQIGLEKKYLAKDLPGNLIVIVYVKNGETEVIELANMLKNQQYPKDNYQIHILFDNCKDESSDIVEQSGGVKVWRINSGGQMGKDHALSWLLERLISFRNVNAFVFLDSNRIIEQDFLMNVNTALFNSDIVVGATEYVTTDVVSSVKNAVKKYDNRIFKTARTVLGQISPIDSGAVAIKQDVLEVLKCVDFKNTESEYKYTIMLANSGHASLFAPDVRSKIPFQDEKHLTFGNKFAILKYALPKIFTGNFKTAEFSTTFFRPSALLVLLLYIGLFSFLYNFEVRNVFFYDIKYIALAAITTFVIFLISLIVSSDEKINSAFLLLHPIYAILGAIFPTRNTHKANVVTETTDEPVGMQIPVQVTDGDNTLKCTIEIKNTGDGMQAIFRYKNKTLTSSKLPSTKAALDEIAEKLKENSLDLKICSSCSHFGFRPNSCLTSQKGLCSQKERMTEDIQPETTLLDCCEHFTAFSDLDNVVEFPKSEDQNDNNQQ